MKWFKACPHAWLTNLRGNKERYKFVEPVETNLPGRKQTAQETQDMDAEKKMELFLREFEKTSPHRAQLKLTPVRGETTVFSSKFGGFPYFPKEMDYPTVREGEFAGKPLHFLAQLNFAELPHIEGFPESGILQFFAGCDGDNLIGLDFDDRCSQNGFRVVFHPQPVTDESQLLNAQDLPTFDSDDGFPFTGEFALKCETAAEPCTYAPIEDFRFEECASQAYNAAFGKSVSALYGTNGIEKDDPEFYDALVENESLHASGCKVGGFPFFTQDDPRALDEEVADCDVTLLQIDSVGDDEDAVMWGDSGVANFFISAENLKNRDFSKVLYNWDCA